MSILRYRAHAACLLAGVVLGVGGVSVLGSDDGSRGIAADGCVHITTSATVCGDAAKRVCESIGVVMATVDVTIGESVTPTRALQAEECRDD